MELLKNDRFRNTTKRNYYGIWKSFNQFVIKLDVKPTSWEERLILYVGFLIQKNRRSQTIKSYISAIRAILYNSGIVLSENRCLLASLTRACSLQNDAIRTKVPISKDLLNLLLETCWNHFQEQAQIYLCHLFRAVFAASFYGMLRIGEVTSGDHPIKAADVHIGENKNKLLFVLQTSKTHWKNARPQLVKITQLQVSKSRKVCPFQILKKFIEVRPSCRAVNTELFFVMADRSPVRPQQVRNLLCTLFQRLDLNHMVYSPNCFHTGHACHLYQMGVSVETIKKLGRWRSNAVYAYLRS